MYRHTDLLEDKVRTPKILRPKSAVGFRCAPRKGLVSSTVFRLVHNTFSCVTVKVRFLQGNFFQNLILLCVLSQTLSDFHYPACLKIPARLFLWHIGSPKRLPSVFLNRFPCSKVFVLIVQVSMCIIFWSSVYFCFNSKQDVINDCILELHIII